MFDDGLAGAVAALDGLAAVDLDAEDDRAALDACVEQQRLANRLAAEQVRLLGLLDRRGAYRADAAVTLASWYRSRTRLDHAEAARRVHAARRLDALPRLTAAFADGAVTAGHVTAVTDAAVPHRAAAVAACEDALVGLAVQARPHDVRVAVRTIRDLADPDGSDTPPLTGCGRDPRRYLTVYPTIDGLTEDASCSTSSTPKRCSPPSTPPTPPTTGAAAPGNAAPTRSPASWRQHYGPTTCHPCRAVPPMSCSPSTSPPSPAPPAPPPATAAATARATATPPATATATVGVRATATPTATATVGVRGGRGCATPATSPPTAPGTSPAAPA